MFSDDMLMLEQGPVMMMDFFFKLMKEGEYFLNLEGVDKILLHK